MRNVQDSVYTPLVHCGESIPQSAQLASIMILAANRAILGTTKFANSANRRVSGVRVASLARCRPVTSLEYDFGLWFAFQNGRTGSSVASLSTTYSVRRHSQLYLAPERVYPRGASVGFGLGSVHLVSRCAEESDSSASRQGQVATIGRTFDPKTAANNEGLDSGV